MTRITSLRTVDVRFPTSQHLDGSDAMNPDPDYSAAYVILETDQPGLEGHGLTFTIGRGNDICCAAIAAMRHLVVGLELSWIAADMGRFWRHVTSDSQLRWIGPDKGAIHLATGAVVNAVWDLWAKAEGKPVWRLVADMSPAELVRCIDFRYITDCITPDEALALLTRAAEGKAERLATLQARGLPLLHDVGRLAGLPRREAATPVPGSRRRRLQPRQAQGRPRPRGRHPPACALAREVLGPDRQLMIDANQVWDVPVAIDWLKDLAFARPWFIEEPTSPDDVKGHRAIRQAVQPMQVATGEMCQNRILFKQFMMRGAIDVVQIDSCRLGGVNEILAVMLIGREAGPARVPACRRRGAVRVRAAPVHDRLPLHRRHARDGRVIEYVDHLHEHFVDPCVVRGAAYMPPEEPGFSITMKAASLEQYRFRG